MRAGLRGAPCGEACGHLQVLHARGVHRHGRQARVVRHKHGHGQVLTVAHFVHVGEDARVQVLCVHVQIPGGRATAEGVSKCEAACVDCFSLACGLGAHILWKNMALSRAMEATGNGLGPLYTLLLSELWHSAE